MSKYQIISSDHCFYILIYSCDDYTINFIGEVAKIRDTNLCAYEMKLKFDQYNINSFLSNVLDKYMKNMEIFIFCQM